MSVNKVVWSEGMFLRPQHFQQQDRHMTAAVRRALAGVQCCRWGFHSLTLDRDALKIGQIRLAGAEGILPDGTAFHLPQDNDASLALELTEAVRDAQIYLCLPVPSNGRQIDAADSADSMAPFALSEVPARDVSAEEGEVRIATAAPRFRLMHAGQDRQGHQAMAVAKVRQVTAERVITLDDSFIPPALDCRLHDGLSGFLTEVAGMLHQRGDALKEKVTSSGRGTSEISEFLLLQMINRYEPLIAYLAGRPHLHPEDLYRELLPLAGELATFDPEARRPHLQPAYDHDALAQTFQPIKAAIRQALSLEIESRVVRIELQGPNRYGVSRGIIADRTLLSQARFVLGVSADLPADRLIQLLSGQAKVGAAEKISQLVNMAQPGITLTRLAAAPRQLPDMSEGAYFDLDTNSPAWQDLNQSGAIAIHVPGEAPNLSLSLWAIKR